MSFFQKDETTPKPFAQRQAELQAASTKVERERDTAVVKLERKIGDTRKKADAELVKLRAAEQKVTEDLAAQLAKDEVRQLRPIVSRLVEAGGAVTRDQVDTLAALYIELDDRSSQLLPTIAGQSVFEHTEKLLWAICEAVLWDVERELAIYSCCAATPDCHLEPARKAEVAAGTRSEAEGYRSLPGLNRLELAHPYAHLRRALKDRAYHEIGGLMMRVAGIVDLQLRHSGCTSNRQLAAKQVEVMRTAGVPPVIMRELRKLHDAEQARLAPERERRNAFHSAKHRLQQLINDGQVSPAQATEQLCQRFKDARELAAEIGISVGFDSTGGLRPVNQPTAPVPAGDSLRHRGSIPFDPFASLRVAQAQASQAPIDPYQGVQRPAAEGENYVVTRWMGDA